MSSAVETISLGKHEEIPVYPQKWAYLVNRTGKTIFSILSQGQNLETNTGDSALGEDVMGWAGSSVYELLVALVPTVGKRIPEYEFKGYHSKEAFDAKEYDPDLDESPTIPEIANAFETAVRVNRFDLVKVLKGIIDPKPIKEMLTKRIVKAISEDSPS